MQKTTNHGLNKPESDDLYNVNDMNDNMDIIDEKLKEYDDKLVNVENKSSEMIRNEITTENITNALGYVPATETELSEVNDKAEEAQAIAKGRNQAHVFSTTEAMQTWLSNADNKGKYNVGDNLYIIDVGVPDWWVSEVLENVDATTGYYYKIAQLETQKVDLTEIENELDELNSNLDNYLPLSGGTITGAIQGNAGGFFEADGNVFIKAGGYQDWLSNILIELSNKVKCTPLTNSANGVITLGSVKIVYGSYPASYMTHDAGRGGYFADINLSSYGFKGYMFAQATALYPMGIPKATVFSVSTSNLSIGCDVNIADCHVHWFVIGSI